MYGHMIPTAMPAVARDSQVVRVRGWVWG